MGGPGEVGDGKLPLGGKSTATWMAFPAATSAGGCGVRRVQYISGGQPRQATCSGKIRRRPTGKCYLYLFIIELKYLWCMYAYIYFLLYTKLFLSPQMNMLMRLKETAHCTGTESYDSDSTSNSHQDDMLDSSLESTLWKYFKMLNYKTETFEYQIRLFYETTGCW